MKRIFSFIICLTVICSMAFLPISCDRDIDYDKHRCKNVEYVWDGDFLYQYVWDKKGYDSLSEYEHKPHYVLCWDSEYFKMDGTATINQEVFYVPAYCNGKEVRYYGGHCRCFLWESPDTYINFQCSKIYFSFATGISGKYSVQAEHIIFPRASGHMCREAFWRGRGIIDISTKIVNVPKVAIGEMIGLYEAYGPQMLSYTDWGIDFKKADYMHTEDIIDEELSFLHIRAANTAYMFNYEGSPNEDYFFINDFERGGLIEDTPYEPLREGYTFGGWYKDSACTEKWDFSADKLPEATYDEEGNFEYVETRLYAKWTKNS